MKRRIGMRPIKPAWVLRSPGRCSRFWTELLDSPTTILKCKIAYGRLSCEVSLFAFTIEKNRVACWCYPCFILPEILLSGKAGLRAASLIPCNWLRDNTPDRETALPSRSNRSPNTPRKPPPRNPSCAHAGGKRRIAAEALAPTRTILAGPPRLGDESGFRQAGNSTPGPCLGGRNLSRAKTPQVRACPSTFCVAQPSHHRPSAGIGWSCRVRTFGLAPPRATLACKDGEGRHA